MSFKKRPSLISDDQKCFVRSLKFPQWVENLCCGSSTSDTLQSGNPPSRCSLFDKWPPAGCCEEQSAGLQHPPVSRPAGFLPRSWKRSALSVWFHLLYKSNFKSETTANLNQNKSIKQPRCKWSSHYISCQAPSVFHTTDFFISCFQFGCSDFPDLLHLRWTEIHSRSISKRQKADHRIATETDLMGKKNGFGTDFTVQQEITARGRS